MKLQTALVNMLALILIGAGCLSLHAQELPKVKRIYVPPYPEGARGARMEGTSIVRITVDKDGKVTNAKFASGNRIFSVITESYAKRWVFEPISNGEICEFSVEFIFELLPETASHEEEATVFLPPTTVKVLRRTQKVAQMVTNSQK